MLDDIKYQIGFFSLKYFIDLIKTIKSDNIYLINVKLSRSKEIRCNLFKHLMRIHAIIPFYQLNLIFEYEYLIHSNDST